MHSHHSDDSSTEEGEIIADEGEAFACYSGGGRDARRHSGGGGGHSMHQYAHGSNGGTVDGRGVVREGGGHSMQQNPRASAQLHPSSQNPARTPLYRHDLVISSQNHHVSEILGIIAVLNPVTTPPSGFTDDFKVVVYSYNDAPTNPPPSRQLIIVSFIERDAFNTALASETNPLSEYVIAVKLPNSCRNDSERKNSGDFSRLAFHLSSSNLVAVFADKTRIGFLLPNEDCNHSASVFFCTNDEAKERMRALQGVPPGLWGRWVPPKPVDMASESTLATTVRAGKLFCCQFHHIHLILSS